MTLVEASFDDNLLDDSQAGDNFYPSIPNYTGAKKPELLGRVLGILGHTLREFSLWWLHRLAYSQLGRSDSQLAPVFVV